MPVEISIICEPGPQSKLIETSIWVSFVLRETEACLVAMVWESLTPVYNFKFILTSNISERKISSSLMMRFPPYSTARFVAALRAHQLPTGHRHLFNLLRKSKPQPVHKDPILTQDNLFHPFSKSPFPAVRARGEAVQLLASCPVCASSHTHDHPRQRAEPRAVKFECPHCGWPTHCSEEHCLDDKEHQKYCSRLREANEDEHDLRSGRWLREFELPGLSNSDLLSSV